MKDYIINLLNNAIKEGQLEKNNNSFDLSLLKEIIDKVNNDKNYFYEYILDLNSELIKELTINIEPESARESFLASIIYLKNLTEINKKEEVKIPLSPNQEEILYELIELIKKVIKSNESKETDAQKYFKKYGKKYEKLLSKFKENRVLNIEDYDLIEELILKYEKGSVDKILNDVVDYLNIYNYRMLPKPESSTIIEETTETDAEPEIEISEENEEIIIKGLKPIINNEVKDQEENNANLIETEEKDTSNTEFDNSKSYNSILDDNNQKDYDKEEAIETLEVEKTTKEPIIEKAKEETSTSLLNIIGLENVTLNDYCTNLINNGLNESAVSYYNENLKSLFIPTNYNGIISINSLSDGDTLTNIFNYFKEINLSEDAIKELLNRATQIFFTKNKDSFKENVTLALSYNADIESLIKTNITYFYNSPEYNQNKIKFLEENGLNVSKIFEIKPQILAIGLDKLLKNIDLLQKYGLNIKEEEYDSLSIISAPNLNIMIDTFIEAGFGTYFLSDGLKNIRSLIIKRIFYAFKNNLNVWNENITKDRINKEYEEWISKERKTLTEEEISYLISDYPVLEYIETSKKPVFFTDMSTAQIRRKYEFRFANNVISRLKVYSIFNVLINHNVNDREALFYAITYNSNLENNDYNNIKKEILGK